MHRLLPNMPVLTLATATAPRMIGSVRTHLRFHRRGIFHVDFRHGGLTCVIHGARGGAKRLLRVLHHVPKDTVVCIHGHHHAGRVARLLRGRSVATSFCRTKLSSTAGSVHRRH